MSDKDIFIETDVRLQAPRITYKTRHFRFAIYGLLFNGTFMEKSNIILYHVIIYRIYKYT